MAMNVKMEEFKKWPGVQKNGLFAKTRTHPPPTSADLTEDFSRSTSPAKSCDISVPEFILPLGICTVLDSECWWVFHEYFTHYRFDSEEFVDATAEDAGFSEPERGLSL